MWRIPLQARTAVVCGFSGSPKINLRREVGDAKEAASRMVRQTRISPGDSIVDVIAKAIDEADRFVPILSEDAFRVVTLRDQ